MGNNNDSVQLNGYDRAKFIQWLDLKGLAEGTKENALYYFDRFPGTEFNQENVNTFLAMPSNNFPAARSFITNYKEFLTDIYPAESSYHKIRIPRRTGRKEIKLPSFVTLEELHKIEDQFPNEREKLMVLISFYGGLRAQGLLTITAADFGWKEWAMNPDKPCKLKVMEKGKKQRIVLVPGFLMKRLYKWCKTRPDPHERLWGIGYHTWFKLLAKASRRSLGKLVSPHKLRHGCATWLLSNGWTIQEIADYLGHKSISTTQIYAHLDKQKVQEKYAGLFE